MIELEISFNLVVLDLKDDVTTAMFNLFDAGMIPGSRLVTTTFQPPILQWCNENFDYEIKLNYTKKTARVDKVVAEFNNEIDATLFRLTWC